MKNLLIKELRLAFHPTVLIFWLLSAMLLIPDYPYTVVAFYTMLGVFFVCLTGRENNDMAYTLNLPIRKRDLVKARFLFVTMIQVVQAVLIAVMIWLRNLLALGPNQAGLNANAAFIGYALLIYGISNLLFMPKYYKTPDKVGKVFGIVCVFIFLIVAVFEASSFVVPFVRDRLGAQDPQFMATKLIMVAICAAIYAALTFGAYARSAAVFEALDL